MGIENFQLNNSEHHFSEREKQEAVEAYKDEVLKEIQIMQDLKPRVEAQFDEWKRDGGPENFEELNRLKMAFEQSKRRINTLAREVSRKYSTSVDVPDFEAMFGSDKISQDNNESKEAA